MYLKNDITDEICDFANYQTGWSPADAEGTPVPQGEVDAFLLAEAKIAKYGELDTGLDVFCVNGYTYSGWVFKTTDCSTLNVIVKDRLPASGTNRYKFYDSDKTLRDFVDNAGFSDFAGAMDIEKNRIMEKYNDIWKQLEDAADMAALDAIAIDFSA